MQADGGSLSRSPLDQLPALDAQGNWHEREERSGSEGDPAGADAGGSEAGSPTLLFDLAALVAQRLLFGLMVMLVIIYVTFLGTQMARGVPLTTAAPEALTSSTTYLQRLWVGDLGMSQAAASRLNMQPVADHLGRLLVRSLGLLALSLLIASIVGTFLGLRAALHRHSNRSLLLLFVSLLGVSAPSFFIAIILQFAAILWTRTYGSKLLPVGGFGWDAHLILPVIVLAARPIAQIARVAFISLSGVLDQEFVRTAQSKGLRFDAVLRRHVYRNAAIPILTTIGTSLRFSLSTLPVVEFFFGWNGAGQMLLRAISLQDHNMAIALLLSFGTLFILINLFLELTYRVVDPRLRGGNDAGQVKQAGSVVDFMIDLVRGVYAGILGGIAALTRSLREVFGGQFFQRWKVGARSESSQLVDNAALRAAWRRSTLGNASLMIGSLVILLLVAVYFFGPQLAPHSPYTTRGIEFKEGKLTLPPFEPGVEYPWGTDVMGRDIMSLVLAGTELTLRLAALVVVARLSIGFVLGTLAGWFNGRWLDRVILSIAEVIAAFPTLLLAMLLILSLGIRTGFRPFLIALSLVGWSEIMQFVRSETMTTRPKPFIESAISIGAGVPRLLWKHLLPNLLPALISLAALEMGAVLMLLGELGYIGIFIGGGAFAELNVAQPRFQYSDVPEWGALLSNVRLYARVYPWTALYPAMAFFISILGFNLLGEGLRRMIENVGGHFAQVWNRYTLVVVMLLLFGVGWLRTNTGPMAYYREQATAFDGAAAFVHVEHFAAPEMMGRALGSVGMAHATEYIAAQFKTLGLQRAGEDSTYFQTRQYEFQQLDALPRLSIVENNGVGDSLIYHRDYREFAGLFRIQGSVKGDVYFLATGSLPQSRDGFSSRLTKTLRSRDFSDQILMMLSAEDAIRLSRLPYRGVLVVAPDGEEGERLLAQSETLPARSPVIRNFGGRETGQEAPVLWISRAVADRILAPSGHSISALHREVDDLGPDQLLTFSTGTNAEMQVEGTTYSGVDVVNVIGHLPAAEGQNLGGQMIVVVAPYDNPPLGPDSVDGSSTKNFGVNNSASGVALMLEVIRTMQETDFQPYKTFLFVAYAGQGTTKGVPASPPDVRKFLEAKQSFQNNFTIEAVIKLEGDGGDSGENLTIEAEGSLRLADLFADAARRVGVSSVRVGEPTDLSAIFEAEPQRGQSQTAPQVTLRWGEAEQGAHNPSNSVDAETLEKAGKAITLALMTIGRETEY